MALSVKTDGSWPGGGFALLSGEGLDGVTAVTIENCLSKQLLDERGLWGKFPHLFPVERTPSGALLLGPDIVDHVPTELFVLLRDQAGVELGRLFWADVMPSRNPGSATSADVLAIHRRRDVVAEAPQAERPSPPPGIELASVVVKPPPPPSLTMPPPPPEASEPAPVAPRPVVDDEGKVYPAMDRPPVPPALNREAEDGQGLNLADAAAIALAPRLMPLWLTITLASAFASSLLLVLFVAMGLASSRLA